MINDSTPPSNNRFFKTCFSCLAHFSTMDSCHPLKLAFLLTTNKTMENLFYYLFPHT